MGANAVTTVYDFTAGQVLTAAQMDNVNCGIPVFATTTTRDAAFGGTGEKTLAEGQMAYIENIAGSSAVQYYDGSAWQTLVVGGLTLITAQTIGTAVSSVTVSNCFSSTYDNYYVTVTGGVASTALELRLTLGATATGYNGIGIENQFNNSTPSGVGSFSTYMPYAALADANTIFGQFRLFGPNLAKYTMYQVSYASPAGGANKQGNYSVYLSNTTSYTDMTFTTSTGTVTGGTIRVYGYANS